MTEGPVIEPTIELGPHRRRLHRKAAGVAGVFVGSYLVLMVAQPPLPIAAVLVAVLVLAAYAWITCIMHDANHGAFFADDERRVLGYSLDLLGASSRVWQVKHNRYHHLHTNSAGNDPDLRQDPFFRLSPDHRWYPWHAAQHLYAPVLYGFLLFLSFFSDFVNWATGRTRGLPLGPRDNRRLALMVVFKVLFVQWAVVVPVSVFGPWALPVLALAMWLVGLMLAVTVQLAHVNDLVVQHDGSPGPDGADGSLLPFIRYQLESSADVRADGNWLERAADWLAGGLFQQSVHHLMPWVPHTAYRQLLDEVDELAAAAGTERLEHPSPLAAVRSHFRWLRLMARRDPAVTGPSSGGPACGRATI